MLVWVLLAFAGIYTSTLVPAAAALAVAAALTRPHILSSRFRLLDAALLVAVAFVWLQLAPLAPSLRDALTPHARVVEEALAVGARARTAQPITIDVSGTLTAALVATLAAAMFWVSREVCARGGVRRLVRTIAWTGLAVSAAAVVVRTVAPGGLLSLWEPAPYTMYGPFVNRNHMATWLVMALPLVCGYIFARVDDRARRTSAADAFDVVMVWLMASAVAMLIAVIGSLSRSGAIGAVAAATCFVIAAPSGGSKRVRLALVAGVLAAIAIAVTNPQMIRLLARFQDSRTTETWSRAEIWRQTLPIVRDFRWTGVGAGAYRMAMLVYQQSDRALFFNQAHNHYLQLAAEGGLLLLIPMSIAAVALGARLVFHLTDDRSPMFWIRVGAVAGIAGVLVQSVWETGLRMPANALLFATLCGVAVHDRRS